MARPFSDAVFRPFENLIRPLDLPIQPLPDAAPLPQLWHFARLFRYVLIIVAVLSVLSAGIGLVVVWALALIVDGVLAQGALAFVSEHSTLLLFAVLIAVVNTALAFGTVPGFAIQFVGSAVLLGVLAWPLAIPAVCWLLANMALEWKVVPIHIERSSRVAAANSRAVGAMTDIYSPVGSGND